MNHIPVRERTMLLTNSTQVTDAFQNHICPNHQVLEGAEGGVKRAKFAQIYPPLVVDALVACVQDLYANKLCSSTNNQLPRNGRY